MPEGTDKNSAQRFGHCRAEPFCGIRAAEVRGAHAALVEHPVHGGADRLRGNGFAQVFDQHRGRQDLRHGVGDPCPAMSGALPWTASNIDGYSPDGLMLPDGAMPSPPVIAAARSLRMSPKRFDPTMTSSRSGAWTIRAARASTCICSLWTSGYSVATSAKISSQNGIEWMSPLDFVAEQTREDRVRASSKAYRMIRSTPTRVKTDSCSTNSSGRPALCRPPIAEYSPSEFSRTMTSSSSSAFRPASTDVVPGSSRTGRRLTYCWNARRSGISRPHSETWSGTPGKPTAPSRIPSNAESCETPSSGIIDPACAYRSQLQSNSVHSNEKSKRAEARSRTLRASTVTSTPIPSPGMLAMR